MSSEVDLPARALSESPAPRRHSVLATLATVFAVAYPLIVYTGLTHWGTRLVALWLLAALGLRVAIVAATRRANSLGWTQGLVSLAPAIALGAVAAWTRDALFLLLFPVLMNATLLFIFARSLRRPTTLVEDVARQIDGDLSPDEVRYCTSLTRAWCLFFAANGALCALLAAFAPLSWWAFYTGFLAYVWIGLFFAVEFVVRRFLFRRFGPGWIDRNLARLFAGTASGDWMSRAEKGGVRSVRLVLFICRYFGRAPIRFVLWFVAAYYVLTDPELRRNSRRYLRRVGVPPTLLSVYRHVRTFAFCATDRIFFLRGDLDRFRISRVGHEHVARLRRSGQGAILVGAHFGSYEALRAAAEEDDVPLSIVAWFDNTAMSYAIFESLAPELARRVIRIRPGEIDHLLEVRRRVQDGELVAFLGDRVVPGGESVSVNFLGSQARFPTGAFSVASVIGCPVLLVFNVYRDPDHYELRCETFSDSIEWPRRGDLPAKTATVQRFAERLEHHARSEPLNWFNFYDYWEEGSSHE